LADAGKNALNTHAKLSSLEKRGSKMKLAQRAKIQQEKLIVRAPCAIARLMTKRKAHHQPDFPRNERTKAIDAGKRLCLPLP
jgi:hypothetical protein